MEYYRAVHIQIKLNLYIDDGKDYTKYFGK